MNCPYKQPPFRPPKGFDTISVSDWRLVIPGRHAVVFTADRADGSVVALAFSGDVYDESPMEAYRLFKRTVLQ